MKRREFIAMVGAAAWPRPGHAQQSTPIPIIGFINGASAELSTEYLQHFRHGLAEMGFAEGKNVGVEFRWADGRYHQLPALAADLVRRQVSVIAATSTPTGGPAKAATSTIPIVFVTGSDPVEQGLVTNLNRPEGNITGVTTLAVELGQKRMELVREVIPTAKLIAVLINPTGPNLESVSRDLHAAARILKLPIHILHVSTEADLEGAFAELIQVRADALVIGTDTFFNSQSKRLATLAMRHRVPAVYQYREFVAAGGLMSYAGSITEAYRAAGAYVGRILKGASPSDLPVQQSTKAELFINLKTAEAFRLTIPSTLLARADEVIE